MFRPMEPRRALAALCFFLSLALAPGARAQSTGPDFSGWQILLDRYCLRLGGKGQPLDTRFDYEQLYVDEGIWTRKRSERLEKVRAQLLSVTPSQLAPRERLAWGINTSNFLVVERATMFLLVPGRQFMRYDSVNEINRSDGSFFEAPVATIEGRSYSLREFERAFVYADSTPVGEPRRAARDPRLYFALCPAAAGGPPLAPRAFRPESLETQLDQAARTAFALPRFVQFTPAAGELVVADALNANLVDFGGTVDGELKFLEKFGSPEVRGALHKRKVTSVARWMMMDWKLNQFERPKPPPPRPENPQKKS